MFIEYGVRVVRTAEFSGLLRLVFEGFFEWPPFPRLGRSEWGQALVAAMRDWFLPRVRHTPLSLPATASVLPNGSPGDGGVSKLTQPDQHGQRPLQLAV